MKKSGLGIADDVKVTRVVSTVFSALNFLSLVIRIPSVPRGREGPFTGEFISHFQGMRGGQSVLLAPAVS